MKIFTIISVLVISFNANSQFWGYSTPQKLKGTVNTIEAEESMPVLSKDSSIMYFTRTFDQRNSGGINDQDIWISKRDENNEYINDKLLIGLNNKFNNAVIGTSGDGNTLYLLDSYKGGKDLKKGISVSKFENGIWTDPVRIMIPNLDIEGSFYGFYINESANVIIISLNSPLGLGQEDLFVTVKSNSGWSVPEHMGNQINSPGYEISPFLSNSQDTLYFSSNGFGGEGDADVFYSVKQGGWSNWTTPVNLGNVINSEKFDAYFSCSSHQVMWSSNRDGVLSDIYVAEILTPPLLSVSCVSTDISEYGVLDGSIDALIEGGVMPFSIKWSNGFLSEDINKLKKGEYSIVVTDDIGQTATSTCIIHEPAPPKDKPIRLPEVRYPINKWELLTDETINSTDSLLFVYELLMEFPGMILELSSHTDSRGSNSMNQKLSENRARACYKYLVEVKGVDPRRIIPVGKGEVDPRIVWKKGDVYMVSKPIDMDGVDEVKLTESYINKFRKSNPELFKKLHQLNRRTEGKLISLDFDANTTPAANPEYLNFVRYR